MIEWIIGMSCCLLLGLLNGSMMAPTHFSSVTGIAYLYSFAIGVAIGNSCKFNSKQTVYLEYFNSYPCYICYIRCYLLC